MPPQLLEPFELAYVRAVCDVIAQTDPPGMSNVEINQVLREVQITSRTEGNKRSSLFDALVERQSQQKAGNVVAAFITAAMRPSRYVRNQARFQDLRDQLNEATVFFGWSVTEEGKVARRKAASTLSEGALLARRLLTELTRRGMHAGLSRYCSEELVNRSLFHAMAEASKSIPARVRALTKLAGDGAALYNGVFGAGGRERPVLLINAYTSDSEISEHRGFQNLLIGIDGHYRNPRAHSTRIDSDENLIDFYDAFSLFSYVHRRLDTAKVNAE